MNCLVKDCTALVENNRRTCEKCYENLVALSNRDLDRAQEKALSTKKLYEEVLKSGTSDQKKRTRKLFKESIDNYSNLFEIIKMANTEWTKSQI
jgi:hypothetical protein